MSENVAQAPGFATEPEPRAAFADQPALAPTVGPQLKAERLRLGLSIADVAQRLKYAPRQIDAVEADDFKALPGLPFVRGFVRGYARLLGVDAGRLVEILERTAEQGSGPITVQLQSVTSTRAQFPAASASHASAWPWVVAIALVIAGIGGYSIYHWQAPATLFQSKESKAPGAATVPVTPMAVGPAAQGDSRATGAAPAGTMTTEGASAAAPSLSLAAPAASADRSQPAVATDAPTMATGPGQGKIRLIFSGESWTEIRETGGRVVFSRNNLAGSEQWADGQPPFELVVGNARDVKLFYRGAEVDMTPYIKVSVARLQLK